MKRLLLVEDDLDTAELTQIMLKALGYLVILASNGVEAVRKAVAELPDLIIMDIHMPVMEVSQRLRRFENIHKPRRSLHWQQRLQRGLATKNAA